MIKTKTSLHILIVEDNPGDYMLIYDYLEENYLTQNIEHAKNFREATKYLNPTGNQKYDVVLLDLSLPDNGGETLINDILLLSNEATVIVLTGYESIDFSIKSLSLGVSDYLVKDDINASSLYKSILYNIERKKTNLKLEESEKRYSNLFHLSPQPMWVYELETLQFLDVNKKAIEEYGYTKEEFLSMTLENIRPLEDLPVLSDAIEKIYNQSIGNSTAGTFRHQKKNGDIIRVDMRSVIINFNGKKAEVVVANDVTKLSTYIDAIQDQNEKFREIAWIQSHVVRAPLARVMAFTEMLKTSMEISEDKQQILDYLVLSANELDGIIKDISNKTYAANVITND